MRKLLPLLLLPVFAYADPPSAGWNFGTDTYGQHDSQLILNSLSDRYGISTYQTPTQSLGTNDYIGENAVKNQLAIQGYTKAYDLNPNSQTGYGYSSVYNQPLPAGVPLTKLTFMGLDGDPTKAQDVYVLTSEYNRLSDQGQAASIATLNSGSDQTNAQTASNTSNIAELGIGLSNEAGARIAGDQALQSQVNAVNQRVDGLDRRLSNDERLKVMPEADIRIVDTKHLSVVVYDAYDATNGRNYAFGMRYTLKLGKSYEEKQIDELRKLVEDMKIERLHRSK
jgi:hypothetical protein